MNKLFLNEKEKVISVCKEYKVTRLYLFGSICTNKFSVNSDIDMLIDFDKQLSPLEKGTFYWDLYDKLRDIFKREVDLITESSLKNPYFIEEVNKTKQLIYE